MTTEADSVWRYGKGLINAIFGLSLILILCATILAPDAVPFLPLVFLGAAFMWYLYHRPLLNLCFVLGAFILVAGFEEGIDIAEIAYALLYTSYLAHWYFKAIFVSDRPLVANHIDRLVLLLFGWIMIYIPISIAFDGDLMHIATTFQSWSLILFYFPVKHAVEHYPNGLKALLTVLVFWALYVVTRNIFVLAEQIRSATAAWEITRKGRVVTNEMLMLVPAYAMLVLTGFAAKRRELIFFFSLFVVFLFGLIMTQGRGYWLAFAFGLVIVLLALGGAPRRRIVFLGIFSVVISIGVVFVIFGDLALFLVAGLWNRILSIGTAATQDISLVNRFLEWRAVWNDIFINPIMGHGMGVPIQYFDITISGTRTRPWIHNGYLAIWFEFGIVGLGLLLALFYAGIRRGLAVARKASGNKLVTAVALMVLGGLSSVLVSTIPSNAFYNSDTILMIGIMLGIGSGLPLPSNKSVR